jgi:uncharacterized protein (DUF2132 family)
VTADTFPERDALYLSAERPMQRNNPLHGITLATIVTELVAHYGFPGLAARIDIRCFTNDPTVTSSLKFLRRTPWAREKVEALYAELLRDRQRVGGR